MKVTNIQRIHIGVVADIEVTETMAKAIERGKALRRTGVNKISVVRTIFPVIEGCSREQACYVILEAVGISSRGALSYFYAAKKSCRKNNLKMHEILLKD
jgi:hypothetical protein